MDRDKEDNPGHSHSEYVPLPLCVESRAHMETKIDNMETSIKAAIAAAFSTVKIVLAIGAFGLAVLQLVIHFWG